MAAEPSRAREPQSPDFIPDRMLREFEVDAKNAVVIAAMNDEVRSAERRAVRSQSWRALSHPTADQHMAVAILLMFAAPVAWLTVGSADPGWALLAGLICSAACLDFLVGIGTITIRNRAAIGKTLRRLFTDQEVEPGRAPK